MIGIAIALALSTVPSDPLTARIAESAVAAQALQGAFDGAWVLQADAREGVDYRLQITDPPDAGRTLLGAWSGPGGETGSVEITRHGRNLVDLVMNTEPRLRLRLRARSGRWTGALADGAVVVLTPHLASPYPPV